MTDPEHSARCREYRRREALKACRHCQKNKVNRPRGLCWRCYYTPGVLELYPSTSKYARRSYQNFSGPAAPCEPTDALPGTEAKLRVLESRAANGQELFHDRDAKSDPPPSWSVPTVNVLFGPGFVPTDPADVYDSDT